MTTSTYLRTPNAMVPPSEWPPAEPLALPTSYELDPFQKHAILAIHAGDHVFVTAKTGSGKTFVGEYLIARAIAAGKRVFYTTPIKSLSNQKYYDLRRLFSHATVGILTGDIKMCPDAQIIVMTTEILRNLFYKRGTATEGVGSTATISLDGVAGVVMDEAHYIMDPDRGHVWEEALILAPRDLQMVLLSATMPSAPALASWLADLHGRNTWLLETTHRVVPLVHGLLEETGVDGKSLRVRPLLTSAGGWIGDSYTSWLRQRKSVQDAAAAFKRTVATASSGGGGGGKGYWNRADHDTQREARTSALNAAKVHLLTPIGRLRRLITWLQSAGQLPALFFVFSRRECERLAAQTEGSLLDESTTAEAHRIIMFHLARHRAIIEKSPQYHQICALLVRGVAFHHSGLHPLLKEIVEVLFTRGFVKALFATETFSVGLNMPTKTVVFLELEKWSDGGIRRPLRPDEYIQMAGRAGRRGLDTQGLVLYEPLRDPVDSATLCSILTGSLPALESRMRFGYDFLLRLKLNHLPIAEQSYWALQQRASRAEQGRALAALDGQVLAMEAAIPAGVESALMTRISLQETIATTVNSKRKKAQQELAKWEVEHRDDLPKGAWTALETQFRDLIRMRGKRDELRSALVAWDAAPLLSLEPQEACLQSWGFLNTDAELTPLGRAATEVHEGHCVLMPLLAASGILATASGEEMAIVLSTFNNESQTGSETDGVSSTATSRAALAWIRDRAAQCQRDAGVSVADNYWETNTVWPQIVAQWLNGAGLAEIAARWELFEGNIQRGLLKIANLLEEWGTIATMRSDLATLEKLSRLRFLRDDIITDSIYLRMT